MILTFIVVEAWSNVGLRGYHSNQKIIEKASMKVETSLKWFSEGRRDRKGEREQDRERELERARNERP